MRSKDDLGQIINSHTSISICMRGVALEVLIAKSVAAIRWIIQAILAGSILLRIAR